MSNETVENGGEQQLSSLKQAKKDGLSEGELWLRRIEGQLNDRKFKDWLTVARQAVALNEEGDEPAAGVLGLGNEYTLQSAANLYHANQEVLAPALYNSTPIADIRPRGNRDDRVARLACDAVEDVVHVQAEKHEFDAVMAMVVASAIGPGRGQARIRYEAVLGKADDDIPEAEEEDEEEADGEDEGKVEDDDDDGEVIRDQNVYAEVVPWDRYVEGPARSWPPPWIAFMHDFTREELEEAGIGKQRLDALPWGSSFEAGADYAGDEDEKRTYKGIVETVPTWEIWELRTRKIWFVVANTETTAKSKGTVLKTFTDRMKYPGFYPVPRPLQLMRRVSSTIPICPYKIYRPMYEEWDRIFERIREITSQMRVRGLVDPSISGDMERLRDARDGEYIEVESSNVEEFFKGGARALDDRVTHMPMEPSVAALQQLYAAREALLQLISRITGINEIMHSAPSTNDPTATEVDQRQTFGTLRLQDTQAEVARFARDLFRLMAHVVSKKFEWETIKAQANIDYVKDLGRDLDTWDDEENEVGANTQGDGPQGGNPMMGHNGGPPLNAPPQQMPGAPPGAADQANQIPPVGQPGQPQPPMPGAMPQPDPQAMRAMQTQKRAEKAAEIETQVQQLLRGKLETYRIDIESNSTVRNDFSRTSNQMNQFIQYTSQYVQAMTGAAPVMPKLLPALTKIYVQFARLYKLGRAAEEAFEEMVDLAQEQVEEGIPGQDNAAAQQAQQQHEMQIQQLEMAKLNQKAQHDQTMAGIKSQQAQVQANHDAQVAQNEAAQSQADREHDAVLAAGEQSHERQMAGHEQSLANMDMASQQQDRQAEMAMNAQQVQADQQSQAADQANQQAQMQHDAQQSDAAERLTQLQQMGERMKAGAAAENAKSGIQKARIGLQAAKLRPKTSSGKK